MIAIFSMLISQQELTNSNCLCIFGALSTQLLVMSGQTGDRYLPFSILKLKPASCRCCWSSRCRWVERVRKILFTLPSTCHCQTLRTNDVRLCKGPLSVINANICVIFVLWMINRNRSLLFPHIFLLRWIFILVIIILTSGSAINVLLCLSLKLCLIV